MDRVPTPKNRGEAAFVSACLKSVNTRAGEKRLSTYLATRPFPHFEAATKPGLVVKTDSDGTRTTGHFVHRSFQPVFSKRMRNPASTK
jgi:hypothetical protein